MEYEGVIYFLMCFLGWGFSTFIMGYLGKLMNIETALFYNLIGVLIVNVFTLPKVSFVWSNSCFWAIMNGIAFSIADLGYYRLSKGGMSISTLGPLTSLYVLFPILLGIFALKEPVSSRKAIGILLAVTAIYLLSSEDYEHVAEHDHTKDVAKIKVEDDTV